MKGLEDIENQGLDDFEENQDEDTLLADLVDDISDEEDEWEEDLTDDPASGASGIVEGY